MDFFFHEKWKLIEFLSFLEEVPTHFMFLEEACVYLIV